MENLYRIALKFTAICLLFAGTGLVFAQNTQIRGFVDLGTSLQDDRVGFGFGEYDLFVTSELNDHVTFLGETVFRYDHDEGHGFEVSVERVIVNYNYLNNHSLLIGKQHTQINYWNESYHHGRVFFPTAGRPLLFEYDFIPLHTMGIALQGQNLGKLRLGYTLLVGNGIGSEEITDNDKYKSLTAAVHIKPSDNLQLGVAFYNDIISEGADEHGFIFDEKTNQQIYTGSIAYFGKKYELLTETSYLNNHTSSGGNSGALASYLYGGIRLRDKWVPYIRFDYLDFDKDAPYMGNDDTKSFLAGIRYEVNYLMVVKLEYQHDDHNVLGSLNKITAQVAIGF